MPLIVSGGDGTLFLHLQQLRPPYPEVVIVPKGRGNALARDLAREPAPVAIDLLEARVQPASGAIYTRLCASSISFGYPTTVTRRALWFRRLRRLSYAAASLFTLPAGLDISIAFDDAPAATRRLTGVLVNNTRHVGGFVALPRASCSDGLADCMELSAGFVPQLAHHLSAMSGLHIYCPTRITQFRHAVLSPSVPQPLMLDGELLPPAARVEIRVLPAALRCSVAR
ncbi:MAG: hypothetical protein HY821_07890 [Acidobacteria bacterium]|nr:hypothetical protein [Acidobacteriota bacterium]